MVYKLNTTYVRFLHIVLHVWENEKLTEFHAKMEMAKIVKSMLKGKNHKELVPTDIKNCLKAIAIKTMQYWGKYR